MDVFSFIMKRTVSRMGNSSLVMSLPHSWVKEHNVAVGDELNVELLEKGLLVSLTNVRYKEKTLRVDVSALSHRTILNILNSAYRLGYQSISIVFKDRSQLLYITELVRERFLGFEVVEEKDNSCIIQNIAEPALDKVDVILRKVFLLTKQTFDLIINDTKESTFIHLHQLENTKKTIDSFTNFVRRTVLLTTKGGKDGSYFMWSIVSYLSLVFHALYYFYKEVCGSKTREQDLGGVITLLEKMYGLLYNCFYMFSYDTINQIDQLREQVYQIISKKKRGVVVMYLFECAREIQMTSSFFCAWNLSQTLDPLKMKNHDDKVF